MRDLRDNTLLRRLGYRPEAHVYAGEADNPRGRHYVSAIDDDGGAVYAVRKSGVPVLLVADGAREHYDGMGHAWPSVLFGSKAQYQIRSAGTSGEKIAAVPLPDIRKHAPALLDQQSGKALFNVADALRLLSKYDALQQRKRAEEGAMTTIVDRLLSSGYGFECRIISGRYYATVWVGDTKDGNAFRHDAKTFDAAFARALDDADDYSAARRKGAR